MWKQKLGKFVSIAFVTHIMNNEGQLGHFVQKNIGVNKCKVYFKTKMII